MSVPPSGAEMNGSASAEPTAVAAEPLDPSLDTDPEISSVVQDGTTQENSADNTRAKDNTDVRQEAMDLNIEETRLPLRKDVSMREFLSKMDDYAPVIPDAVTFHALTLAGLKPPPLSSLNTPANSSQTAAATQQQQTSESEADHVPLRLARLISLATQKFIADIATDAYQYSRMRTGVLTSNSLNVTANPGSAAASAGGTGTAAGNAGGSTTATGGPGKSGANGHILGVQRAGFGGGGQGGGQNRAVLTMEDLGMAVGEYGVNVKRGEFYR